MQNEFQPEQNLTPPAAKSAAPLPTETEADAQAVADITKRLDTITRRAKLMKRRAYVVDYVVTVIFAILGGLLAYRFIPHSWLNVYLIIFIFLVGPITARLRKMIIAPGIPKFDAADLAKLGGVKAISPLLQAWKQYPAGEQSKSIEIALLALLPQLKVSDAAILTPAARGQMHEWLSIGAGGWKLHRYAGNLRLATLKALEQVGDSTAISIVERLANINARTASDRKAKQAALECLPMLRANCGAVEAARTLLRASHAEAARPDTLLRPASGASQTAAQDLLRPSDENETP